MNMNTTKTLGAFLHQFISKNYGFMGDHTNKQIAVAFFNHLKERTDEFTQTQELKNGEK